MENKTDKELALALLEWHGGQGSAVYAVGSSMLAAMNRDQYIPSELVQRAINELRHLKRDANFPEAVTERDEAECNDLAEKLQVMFGLEG